MRKMFLWAGCLLLLCQWGCVSTSKHKAVADDYHLMQQQLATSEKAKNQCRKDQNALNKKMASIRAENKVLSQKMISLNKTMDSIRAENEVLSQKMLSLTKTIKNKEAIISIQTTVIRLFDDAKQTLQNSIREQIDAQNLEP